MKKIFSLVLCILCFTAFSQVQKYHRVKIETGKDGLMQLALKGVTADHGEHKKGQYFIGEFSDSEMQLIKETGLPYEVLITDMAAYYVKRNQEAGKTASTGTNCNGCPNYRTPNNFALGSMGGFYTYPEMLDILDSMAAKYPNLITIKQPIDTGHTFEGRQLLYVKISDNPNVAESEPQVLYTSLHHAREPESLTQLIFYMWYLLENYNTDPEITYLVNNLELYFIPCVNPDGYIYNHTTNPGGGGMWRKNRRNNNDGTYGIDLNRNYGYNWGYDNIGSSPTSSSDTYRGPSAFSESETQMVQRFCNAHTFQLAINNHTYDNVLVQPYGYSATAYTPDSLLFTDFGMRLTFCDGFTYGTAQQTVGYTANGDSDDWMYGEQSSKPKIYAMTPEAGSTDDGFWPLQTNIAPIAERTLDQNIYAARLVAAYAEVKDASGPFISQSGYIKYNLKRLGLQAANFSVSITPLGSNFQSVGGANAHSSMAHLQSLADSISFTLNSGITVGTPVQFLLNVSNGFYTHTDTITRMYGIPVTIFSDNCSATTQWTGTTWGTSGSYYVSPSKSITDSPSGNYATNANKSYTAVPGINLTTAVAAYLEYYARWEIEKNYDYAEVKVSTNGGTTYTPMCAMYTHAGNSNQDQGNPLYDGFQRMWVKERVDLSAYLGQTIKLRFTMVADGGVEYDGFYFDDITVKILDTSSTGIAPVSFVENAFELFPNPNDGIFTLAFTKPVDNAATVNFKNLLGETVFSKTILPGTRKETIDLSSLPAGAYFMITDDVYFKKAVKVLIEK